MGFAQAMSGMFVGDEIIKASLGTYVFEQMEIAAYKTLIAAAEECDDQQTKRVCETFLYEKKAMARATARDHAQNTLHVASRM
jgi:ferritin-like metal-binding protein YciE